jgi:hypothetical protein
VLEGDCHGGGRHGARGMAMTGGLKKRFRGQRPYAALAVALPWWLVRGSAVDGPVFTAVGIHSWFFSTKENTVFLLHH